MLSLFYLVLVFSSFTGAEIVTGKCPTVLGTNFNCTEVLHNFYEVEHKEDYQKRITLLIYAFLPSSPKSKSFNIFAFNFPKEVSISDYYAILSCASQQWLKFHCGHFVPMRPFKQIGIDFKVYDQWMPDNKIIVPEIIPGIATDNNEVCNSYLKQNFRYISRVSFGKYFAIWGCNQINEVSYDRGLWIFGANENGTDFGVADVKQVVDEALKDIGLDQTVNIKENLLFNQNIFQNQEEKCPVDRFHFKCNKMSPLDEVRLVEKQKQYTEKEKEDQEKKVILFGMFCVVLGAIVSGTCYCIIKWLIWSIITPLKQFPGIVTLGTLFQYF